MRDDCVGDPQVSLLTQRASLRFKSWLPEYAGGSKPAVVAGWEPTRELDEARPRPARVLCLGPSEWLIVSREGHNSNLPERIAGELGEYGLAFTDVSDELAAIELRGSLARDLLASGCELDTSSKNFPVGRCVRARLANVEVVIDCVAAAPCFEIYFSRSHFRYLRSWLINTAVELEKSLTTSQ